MDEGHLARQAGNPVEVVGEPAGESRMSDGGRRRWVSVTAMGSIAAALLSL